jgi:hypothetical protein
MLQGLNTVLRRRLVVTLLVTVSLVGGSVGYRAAQLDAKADEYAVFSAVVSSMSTGTKLAVIKGSTVNYSIDAGLLHNQALARLLSPLLQATIDDYIAKSQVSKQLSRDFRLKLPYLLFTKEDEQLFEPDGSWDRYFQKYPDSGGLITLSAVGFNSEKSQAFVYAARTCGRLCGRGFMVVLTKEGDIWSIRARLDRWIA